ncbi:MAG: sensor histidine kinase [Sideroxydans sp.]
MPMIEETHQLLQQSLKQLIRTLLKLTPSQVVALFVILAVLVSMVIVAIIDLSWDGRLNAEMEFAGIVTPFLDALLIVSLLVALLGELRGEAERRRMAEDASRKLNEELEAKVELRTRLLLEAQEELVRKEKLTLLGQVADNVGHELRNPLGVMNNAVYFLQSVLGDADETTREYLGMIKDEIADAERIVSDLLDAVRTKPPHPETVNVAEVIGHVLRKRGVPASVAVKVDIPQAPALVRADPKQVFQVLWNLVSNAVDAMPEGGTLDIRADEDPQALRISVKDSGGGMTPEQQVRLFQPLFTTKARRVGLGLVVVKNLVQANGGKVEVQSEAGKGSTFTVTLPKGG